MNDARCLGGNIIEIDEGFWR